ncbi:MAG: sugar ABC transporter ATP-binding protein [Spirochaetaceae bacterium]|jgi:erythritol transport system ATP-binding protein|nr:sugar ABC transporter ATP-binding protein [Spirochaetaceae bacterium]
MEEIVLEADQITKIYPGTTALYNADLKVRRGKINVLVGENGAGKSTMMKIIAGVETKTSGTIYVNGKEADYATPNEAIQHGVGIIYQELNLFPNLSIAENMFMTREIKKNSITIDHKKQNDTAVQYLKKLNLNVSPNTLIADLRVGQQQLVEIAKVLAQNARIIIMDEPTSALTEAEVATLFDVIGELRRQSITIIYISHRLEEIMHIGDYITILRDGKFIEEKPVAEIDIPWIIDKMTGGHKIENVYARRQMGKEILRVKNLSLPKKNGHGFAVNDVSFSLRAGEILGLYGLLGAGRTELLECLIGEQENYTGTIELEGKIVTSKTINGRIQDGFALIPEDRKTLGIFGNMIILENMVISALSRFFRRLFLQEKMEKAAAGEVSKDLNVKAASIMDSINSLSGGNQQKIIIGRSLLTNPKILLMDDPTRGIDISAKYDVYEICKRLAGKGIGIIFVSSEMQEMHAIPDRVLVLSQGRLKGEFMHEELTEEKLVSASAITITTGEEYEQQ